MEYKVSKYNIVIEQKEQGIILFNSASGSLIELSCFEYESLKTNTPLDSIKDTLIKQGFLVPSNLDEYNKVLYNESKLIYSSNEKLVFVIAPTLNCNMSCYYCFENKKDEAHTMSVETEQAVYDYIVKEINLNGRVKELLISWFGGEPTLCFDTIRRLSKKFIEFCNDSQIKYSAMMITNGSLLTKEKAVELVNYKVKKIQITFDGSRDYYCKAKNVTPEIYETVKQNIRDICNILKVTIRLNCSEDNINSLIELVHEFDDCEKLAFYIAPIKNHNFVFDSDNSGLIEEDDFQRRKKILYSTMSPTKIANHLDCGITPIGVSCGLLKSKNSVIGPDGELYYCEHDLGINNRIVGDIWGGLYYNKYYMEKLAPLHLERCENCVIFPLCQTGCQSEVSQFDRTKAYCSIKLKGLIEYLKKYYKEVDYESNN